MELKDFVLALFGIIGGAAVTYVFQHLSQMTQKPFLAIRSVNVVSDQSSRYPGVEVRYHGTPVNNITSSRILYWNDGRKAITRSSFGPNDPLRIEMKNGAVILEAEVIAFNNKSSQYGASLSPDREEVTLEFDFIGRHQGMVVKVIHTGKSSDDLDVRGLVINGDILKKTEVTKANYWVQPLRPRLLDNLRVTGFSMVLLAVLFLGLDIIYNMDIINNNDAENGDSLISYIQDNRLHILGYVIFAGVFQLTVQAIMRRIQAYRGILLVPQGLDKFLDD